MKKLCASIVAFTLICTLASGAASAGAAQAGTPTLATYHLTPGWATFGVALPQGAARDALAVGTLATQTDVKTTWPDGSIRFAIVTARVEAAAWYAITATARPAGALSVAWPPVTVRLVIAGQTWTAALPPATADRWLNGPLAHEARALVAPVSGGQPHVALRAVIDVRTYADGARRIDVTMENGLDVAGAGRAGYDVTIAVGSQTVFERKAVSHPYLARWRAVTGQNLAESVVTPDVSAWVAAGAVPRYLTTVLPDAGRSDGPEFDILRIGALHEPMNDHGGRTELAPYPDWTARYLVHRTPALQGFVLKHGTLAGSYSIHIKEPDGVRLISIDDHPNFWLDTRADPDGRPRNGLAGTGYAADISHQPSLAFVPYLLTGDRYYADEMRYWANYCLIGTFQDGYYNRRGGSQGLLREHDVRGMAWAIRNLADAAAYLPDADPYRAYFLAKLQNNLRWLDDYAGGLQTPLGTLFTGKRPEDGFQPPYTYIALWEHNYLAWALDRVQQHGLAADGAGALVRDRIAAFQLKLFTSEQEGYPRLFGAPYILAIGRRNGERIEYFGTMREVFRATYGDGASPSAVSFSGYYGVDARLSLLVASRLGLPGASEALGWLMSRVDSDGRAVAADVNVRSGWAIAPAASADGRPNPPNGFRVIR